MPYNPNLHHRRSIRLKGYDYTKEGLYFITLCTQNRKHLFGNIEKGEMILNEYGKIIENEWLVTTQIRKNIAIHEFVIMPNHFHAIIEILFPAVSIEQPQSQTKFASPSQTIGAIIRGFKGAGTKRIKELSSSLISTGELLFAPSDKNCELLFAPTDKNCELPIASIQDKGELQFAPTTTTTTTTISLTDKIWQRNYYEHIIRDQQSYQRISDYIINNPAKWTEDKFNSK